VGDKHVYSDWMDVLMEVRREGGLGELLRELPAVVCSSEAHMLSCLTLECCTAFGVFILMSVVCLPSSLNLCVAALQSRQRCGRFLQMLLRGARGEAGSPYTPQVAALPLSSRLHVS
jgi:hypothetical protein